MSEWIPDISEFQQNVDMSAVKNAGAAGVILRAGFGTLRADNFFQRNRANADRVGLPWMAYWFNYPNYNPPEAEASVFNQVVGPLPFGRGMAADFENDANNWPNNGLDWARRFLNAAGPADYVPAWYASPSFVNPHNLGPLFPTYPYWVAHYGVSSPSQPVPAVMWQFTSSGSVAGVSGNCDVSVMLRGKFTDLLYGPQPVTRRVEDLPLIVQRISNDPDAHGVGAVYSFDFINKVYIAEPALAGWAAQFNPEPYKGKLIPMPGGMLDRFQEETRVKMNESEKAFDPGEINQKVDSIDAKVDQLIALVKPH